MMGTLFGTDGIRGIAGEPPLDDDTVERIGAALVETIAAEPALARLLVGRDTRESGPLIERALVRGIRATGASVVSTGVLPTPAVAYLTSRLGFSAGIVISASHNPFEDNGIKVFATDGVKLDDEVEAAVEAIVARSASPGALQPDSPIHITDYRGEYVEHLLRILEGSRPVRRLRVALDCANGATTNVAPRVFETLGLDVRVIGAEPDGRNINRACGSTAPEALAAAVLEGGCDLGVAYDGDGDRTVFVDETGAVVDGDAVLYLCARRLQAEGTLSGQAVVATVMSNIGLELALHKQGIELVRCPVGDRHVMHEMRRRGIALGGEQSGHVIFASDLWTGDGIGTSLHVLRTMAATGRSLHALASELVTYPQVLLNLRVPRKVDLATVPEAAAAIARAEVALTGRGRLLVRYSGTEPLLRVMLEGEDRDEIQQLAESIVNAVRAHFGEAAPACL